MQFLILVGVRLDILKELLTIVGEGVGFCLLFHRSAKHELVTG